MRELSLHILDIVQNSLVAKATLITISIYESARQNLLKIEIGDNGKGIEPAKIPELTDPFYTTRSSRKVGLGLSLFQAAAERSGGNFSITSRLGQGTTVVASFKYDDLDRAPLGNITDTILTLIVSNPAVDFSYHHQYEEKSCHFDTRELKKNLGQSSLGIPALMIKLREYLGNMLTELYLEP